MQAQALRAGRLAGTMCGSVSNGGLAEAAMAVQLEMFRSTCTDRGHQITLRNQMIAVLPMVALPLLLLPAGV